MAEVKASHAFDLSVFDTKTVAESGFEVAITKPDGDPSGLFITVLGQDSTTFQKLNEQHQRKRIRTMSKLGRNAIDSMFDEGKSNDMDLTVACTISYRLSTGDSLTGFDLGKDKDATRSFFEKFPLVYDQVRVAMADRANFTAPSHKQ